MPFVKEQFYIEEEQLAFLFVMKTLNFTQGQAQRHVAKGRLLIDGKSIFYTGLKVKGLVEMVFFRAKPKGVKPTFQTNDFMVFDKPSGVLVHPNTMSTPYSMLDEVRGIAGNSANSTHRIDMETSGLLLSSKHKKAESFLKQLFEKRTIKKSYLAWIDGELKDSFTSKESISVNKDGYEKTKHKVFIDNINGKLSHTDFIPLEYDSNLDATLVACYPHTGRTHQIRIHLFHVKHPILGDPIYGTSYDASDKYLDEVLSKEERLKEMGASRLMLHAQSLTFTYKNMFYIESRENFKEQKLQIHPKEKRVFNSKIN